MPNQPSLAETSQLCVQLAKDQGGVLSVEQLVDLGVSRCRRETLERRGALRRHLGCWVVTSLERQVGAGARDAHALRLVLPVGTVVTGAAAASLQGAGGEWPYQFRVSNPMAYLPVDSHMKLRGVRFLRKEFDGKEIRSGPLLLADRATALLDCIESGGSHSLEGLLDHFLQRRWITAKEVESRWERRSAALRGRRRSSALRQAVEQSMDGSQSCAERLLTEALKAAGIHKGRKRGWHANHLVHVPDSARGHLGLRPYRIDVAWPDCKFAVEVDGRAFHSGDEAFESDRHRRMNLSAAGWTVVEVTWKSLTVDPGPCAVTASIKATLLRLRSPKRV